MTQTDILVGAIQLVVFIFSVVVHENAHGLAAEFFGDKTARDLGRITMNPVPHVDPVGSLVLPVAAISLGIPFIGWAKPVPVDSQNLRNPIVHNAYVAAAGPLSNLILALLGSVLLIVVLGIYALVPALQASGHQTLVFFNTFCEAVISLNCVLAVFNMLPIPPLDGHWILIAFLPPGPREAVASLGRFGFLIIIVLLWTRLLWRIIGPVYNALVGFYFSLAKYVLGFF